LVVGSLALFDIVNLSGANLRPASADGDYVGATHRHARESGHPRRGPPAFAGVTAWFDPIATSSRLATHKIWYMAKEDTDKTL
jgi:hypothetical protein